MSGVCMHGEFSLTWQCMHRSCKHGHPLVQKRNTLAGPCSKCAVEKTVELKALAREYGLPWPEED